MSKPGTQAQEQAHDRAEQRLNRDVARRILRGGDGTYGRYGGRIELACGYQVGGKVPALTFEPGDNVLRVEELAAWLIHHNPQFIGLWADTETSITYIDSTDHVASRLEAQNLLQERQEQCAWGWALSNNLWASTGEGI